MTLPSRSISGGKRHAGGGTFTHAGSDGVARDDTDVVGSRGRLRLHSPTESANTDVALRRAECQLEQVRPVIRSSVAGTR